MFKNLQRENYVLRLMLKCYENQYDDYYLEFANCEDFEKAQDVIEDAIEEYEEGEEEILDFVERRLKEELGEDKFGWTRVYEDSITLG